MSSFTDTELWMSPLWKGRVMIKFGMDKYLYVDDYLDKDLEIEIGVVSELFNLKEQS